MIVYILTSTHHNFTLFRMEVGILTLNLAKQVDAKPLPCLFAKT
jgi:hypothetical protein